MELWTGRDDHALAAWCARFEQSGGLVEDDEQEPDAEPDRMGNVVLMSWSDYLRITSANSALAASNQNWVKQAQEADRQMRLWRTTAWTAYVVSAAVLCLAVFVRAA